MKMFYDDVSKNLIGSMFSFKIWLYGSIIIFCYSQKNQNLQEKSKTMFAFKWESFASTTLPSELSFSAYPWPLCICVGLNSGFKCNEKLLNAPACTSMMKGKWVQSHCNARRIPPCKRWSWMTSPYIFSMSWILLANHAYDNKEFTFQVR